MRKLFLIVFIFSLCAGKMYGQIQNANWVFSKTTQLDFNAGPPVLITRPNGDLPPGLSAASISDRNGNLLFYTNGKTVFNKNHVQMTNGNGLLGDEVTTQSVVIVPNPADEFRYYIITLSSELYSFPPFNAGHGMHFSEVDMTDGIGFVIPATKNTLMHDENGTDIDNAYGNHSERMTTAAHGNGHDYWIIAQIGDNALCWPVTDSGIGDPVSQPAPEDQFTDAGSGMIKISPQSDKILFTYRESPNGVGFGTVYDGTFDNMTGSFNVSLLPLPSPGSSGEINAVVGAEFSPDNNLIYYSVETYIVSVDRNINPENNDQGMIIAVSDDVKRGRVVEIVYEGPTIIFDLQRALDGKIYFNDYRGLVNGVEVDENKLGVINNPNEFGVNCDITIDSFDIGALLPGDVGGLPQWVQGNYCQPTLTITQDVTDPTAQNTRFREAEIWIKATNTIEAGAETRSIYHAGNFVELNPGFETDTGAEFTAYIEGCSYDYQYRGANGKDTKKQQENIPDAATAGLIRIFPNPASTSVTIQSDATGLKEVSITAMDGRRVYAKAAQGRTQEIDVSTFSNGIYIINIVSDDGQLHSAKLVKN